jgi:hypothetical protein
MLQPHPVLLSAYLQLSGLFEKVTVLINILPVFIHLTESYLYCRCYKLRQYTNLKERLFFCLLFFVRLLALRPLLTYCASLG